jgi:prepilin-type N-terminal cleavage/methylation domain-containing protein
MMPTFKTSRRGYTLIEITLVVSIIVVLVALTISAGSAILAKAQREKTEGTLRVLDQAMAEWSQVKERQMTYGLPGLPFDARFYDITAPLTTSIDFSGAYENGSTYSESDLLEGLNGNVLERGAGVMPSVMAHLAIVPQSKSLLGAIDPSLSKPRQLHIDGDAIQTMLIVDAWMGPVLAILPGRVWIPAVDQGTETIKDTDGTIRTIEEVVMGACVNGRPYFVSSGPDRRFGHLEYTDTGSGESPPSGSDRYQQTADNLYSYEVLRW